MLICILLPIVMALIVAIINGDIKIQKSDCPPHYWSRVAMTDKLVCMHCSKESNTNPFTQF
jgi:hypothetical protein